MIVPGFGKHLILYKYPPEGGWRWIVVDIYRDAKPNPNPEGDSCFSIYQIRWIKKCCFDFFFWNFRETTSHFSLRPRNSEYPRTFRVTGANQNARKLLSTDLVNTKVYYSFRKAKIRSCQAPPSLDDVIFEERAKEKIKPFPQNQRKGRRIIRMTSLPKTT